MQHVSLYIVLLFAFNGYAGKDVSVVILTMFHSTFINIFFDFNLRGQVLHSFKYIWEKVMSL